MGEWKIPRYAVMPTNGRECLTRAVEAIAPQVDLLYLIWNGPPAETLDVLDLFGQDNIWVLGCQGGMNISHWWNDGLYLAKEHQQGKKLGPEWDVAVLNDDVIVTAGWFEAVATRMRALRCAAACSGGIGQMPHVHTKPGPVPLHTRMQGFAFMLAGEKRLKADENLVWWFSDDDLDWQARQAGGMVQIPGHSVAHLYPNGQMTPELHAQTAVDAVRFKEKWGMMPW